MIISSIFQKYALHNHIYIHTCIHACIHAYTHAYMHDWSVDRPTNRPTDRPTTHPLNQSIDQSINQSIVCVVSKGETCRIIQLSQNLPTTCWILITSITLSVCIFVEFCYNLNRNFLSLMAIGNMSIYLYFNYDNLLLLPLPLLLQSFISSRLLLRIGAFSSGIALDCCCKISETPLCQCLLPGRDWLVSWA